MQIARAPFLCALSVLALLGAAGLSSCGQDEGSSPNVHPGDGGSDSEIAAGQNGGGNASQGGNGNSAASGGVTPSGGAGEGGTLGGAAGASSDAGASGGSNTLEGEQLLLCKRLSGLVDHADKVSRAFSKTAYADCRVKWVVPLEQAQLVEYKNRLVSWSLAFWGCQGNPVTDFALAYHEPDLSQGDADILIQHYLDTVGAEVDLSPAEQIQMKAALERLAAPLLVSASAEPSQSRCPVDMGSGGAGGEAGAAGAAGAAGLAGFGGNP
jgi:hypothetical protein